MCKLTSIDRIEFRGPSTGNPNNKAQTKENDKDENKEKDKKGIDEWYYKNNDENIFIPYYWTGIHIYVEVFEVEILIRPGPKLGANKVGGIEYMEQVEPIK